ncbi:radical SAM protein [Rhodothalassium salexigens]|uniref:PA0069 family radical SAM protein n=1 Tax=Rhodothalassium salexigens TaxID=1086 RepID=UPI001912C73F|nr:PA0069 family radical SAM protein [Rhodothalassium salexigens]MBK5911366.1 radical SAM protein [Rhodothalassium salexigens]MBK5921874.1 radical SAM protein [Rhodothalassium salexigens]
MLDGTSQIKPQQRRGRGAGSNAAGRYERHTRQGLDDGWGSLDAEGEALRTHVTVDAARRVITRNNSPDIPFDRSVNPYRGCEHGCVYCFARPSHAHLGLSPGLDFETRLFAKADAAARLRAELARPGYVCAPIAFGTNTDPYQLIERDWRVMRGCLEVLAEARHPVTITTKSHLVTRDVDLLAAMAADGLAKVAISITTLDHRLARDLEPRASTPGRRLAAIETLAAAGVPVGVMVAPVIPALTDHEVEAILEAGARAGAVEAGWILLRLPGEVAGLFREWLEDQVPDRARRVLNRLREARGGRDNDPRFGHRFRGEGPAYELLAQRADRARARLGLQGRAGPGLRCDLFQSPRAASDQLDLFG